MATKQHVLHFESHGKGPTVVFLHGFLSSSLYWRKVTDLVSKDFRVITIDLLGFGNSPKPRRSRYDYDAHLQSINHTLEVAKVTEPFILVGHSMGALLSLRFSTIHGHRVKKLILTNMPVMLNPAQVRENIFKANLVVRLGLTPYTHRLMWGTTKTLYRFKLLPKGAFGELAAHIEYVFKHSPMSRLKSFRRVILHARTEIDLKAVKVKTTVLSGLDDRKIYIENLRDNIKLSPHVVVQNFRTGHHIPQVMPQVLVNVITD